MNIQDHIIKIFHEKFGTTPAFIARAPGRVNLLGEHVDYNDGFVLPAAIDRATYIAFSPSGSDRSTIVAADFNNETTSFTLKSISSKSSFDDLPLAGWAKYPAGVAWSLMEKGLVVNGMNAVFASDVPRGAGLSSSASVELTFGVAWMNLGGWKISPMDLALLCQRAENQYVGVNCGIMDQFASACGETDRLMLLDCRSLEYRSLPLPQDIAIVIADTSVRRSLVGSAYNDRRAACEEAVLVLREDLPGIKALRDVSVDDFYRLCSKLRKDVEKRARHIVEEIERTKQAIRLLENGNVREFGRLMNECHVSLRDLYEVSCPELDAMARIAQSLEGCYGARLTGAGFGGCTVNLVAREKVNDFVKALTAGYEFETRLHPEIYICKASSGASLI
ncbi:MAG: galactokinase [Chloroflexi bacterium]|nr:galactokinase [Chloroflexota bacterium]